MTLARGRRTAPGGIACTLRVSVLMIVTVGVSTGSVSWAVPPPFPPMTDFTVSNYQPDRGERVTFTVDEGLTPVSWNFASPNCDGDNPLIDCSIYPSWCRQVVWTFPTDGLFDVTLTTTTGSRTRTLWVQRQGDCPGVCSADSRPDSDFSISPYPAFVGETVTFTHGGQVPLPCTYSIHPTSADVGGAGASLSLTINTVAGCTWTASSSASWITITSQFSGSGPAQLSYTVAANYGGARSGTITVAGLAHTIIQKAAHGATQEEGEGQSTEEKALMVDFNWDPAAPEIGESVFFTLTGVSGDVRAEWDFTDFGCPGIDPLTVCDPDMFTDCHSYVFEFSLPGTRVVSVTVRDPNSNALIGSAQHSVTVLDTGSCEGAINDEATEWYWTVSMDGEVVVTSTDSEFSHVFDEPGLYLVELEASNCVGSRSKSVVFEIQRPINDSLVAAAVHTPGLNDTFWKTDLKAFNPCDYAVTVSADFLPEKKNNVDEILFGIEFTLPPKGTKIVDDVVAVILGDEGHSKGSLWISFEGYESCQPLVMSRTYNDTEHGTFGQYVEAVSMMPVREDVYHFTGLAQSDDYRANLGLANFGDKTIWNIKIRLLDKAGQQLGNKITTNVPAYSTRQIVEVAMKAGLDIGKGEGIDDFSAEVDINDGDVAVYASVADQLTGDPVLYWPIRTAGSKAWIPGVAHNEGKNESVWRSDVIFFNALSAWNKMGVEYFPSESGASRRGLETNIPPWRTQPYRDALVSMLGMPDDMESLGYLIVSDLSGLGLPQIAARTYNLDPMGGTYGQSLKVFGVNDLLHAGDTGYIPGVSGSSSSTEGFRVNLGILNTREDGGARVDIRVYDSDGTVAAEILDLWLPPGKLRQMDLFKATGIGLQDMQVSVEVTVLSGGPVAVYASEADNRTQDPVLIPAVVQQ